MHSCVSECMWTCKRTRILLTSFFLFCCSSLSTHVMFPSHSIFSSRRFPLQNHITPYTSKLYRVAIFHLPNLTSPLEIIHALILLPFMWHFRLLLCTFTHSLYYWGFANTLWGTLIKYPPFFAPLAAFLFTCIYMIMKPVL